MRAPTPHIFHAANLYELNIHLVFIAENEIIPHTH